MCGITGIFAFNEIGRINMIHLSNATNSLSRRGPDNRGTFISHFVGLGHNRLSIIDLTSEGNQPMKDSTGRYTIVYNGEIYNYKALSKELEGTGVNFNSATDTEVLLNLFIHYKEKCLEKLNGFFAFAIYDSEEDTIFLARDRYGIKPLIYYQDEDKFIFASEMKSILQYAIDKNIDLTSLYAYLQLNYIPAPETIFQNVKKLMPGHFMKIKKGNVEIEEWYKIPYDPSGLNPESLSYEQQKEKLSSLMDEAVRMRLVADVPVGTFLSGGIDSSVITAIATRHTQKLNTFSIGYKDEPFFDETRYAMLVAKKYNTAHTVFPLSNDDLYEHLFDILDYLDEPFADSSAIPVYILSKHTKKVASVALSGDGADELFSGYNKHAATYRAVKGGLAVNIAKWLLPVWRQMPKSRNNKLSNVFRQLEKFGEGCKMENAERYWRWAILTSDDQAKRIFSTSTKEMLDQQEFEARKKHILRHIKKDSSINDILYTDMELVLPNDMLTKVDLMSMANGLEVRVPFLDKEIVKFAFELPEESKINAEIKKRIVQDTFRDLLPPELYRRPKHGFEVPLLKWFRRELKPLITDDLLSEDLINRQGIFNYDEILKLKIKLFSPNPGDIHARIWGLIVFQWWWKRYFN
jgi:asparagine synthase (glutamine-hydrolysing)